jgi:hypothetical protein
MTTFSHRKAGSPYSCAMELKWGDKIFTLMVVQRPVGTHFSKSTTAMSALSPLVRNAKNALDTHAVLRKGLPVAIPLAAGAAVCVLGTLAIQKAVPHVKSKLISLRSQLSHQVEENDVNETIIPLRVVPKEEPEAPEAPPIAV